MIRTRTIHPAFWAALWASLAGSTAAMAETAGPGEAWRTSPFHGAIDGATGKAIPCLCRFRGQDYRLGEAVCMTTHVGTVLARCDLALNNTTWAPTSTPCMISYQSRPLPAAHASAGE